MYPTTQPIDPAGGGVLHSYVPYFYESGLYRFRPITSRGAGPVVDGAGYGRYDFSSQPPLWAPPRPQTVEQIVAHGYLAVPPSDPETALISDRQHTARLGLDDLISQLRDRYQIFQENLYQLHQGVCEADNEVFRQEADQGTPADNRQRYSANKRIQDLYEQMRAERVRLWQDVSKLRLVLPEAAQQYLASYRKAAILSERGEGP